MTFEYYDGWVRRELWALSWMHSHGAMLIVTNAGSASDVLPSSKSIATCKPKGAPNVRPPTGFRFPAPRLQCGAPGKIGLMPVLRIGSLKGILPRRCHRSPLARLRGRRLLAVAASSKAWCGLAPPGQAAQDG